jgi:hypothetical protein
MYMSCDLPYTGLPGEPHVAIGSKGKIRRIHSQQYLAYHFVFGGVDDRKSVWYGRP